MRRVYKERRYNIQFEIYQMGSLFLVKEFDHTTGLMTCCDMLFTEFYLALKNVIDKQYSHEDSGTYNIIKR